MDKEKLLKCFETALRYGYLTGYNDKSSGVNIPCDDQCWEDFKKQILKEEVPNNEQEIF